MDCAGGAHRGLVLALWALLRASATKGCERESGAAARECRARLEQAMAGDPHFVLQLRGGALHGNGARIRPDLTHFAPTAGLVAMLQQRGVSDVLLLANVTADDLLAFARCLATDRAGEGLGEALLREGCATIQVGQDADQAPEFADDLREATARRTAAPPSQLGAVFLMQRFADLLERRGPLAGMRARTILQNVLHAMIRRGPGLEPLGRLARGGAAAAESVRACVLAVRAAEELSWSEDRGLDAGAAALVGEASAGAADAEAAQLGAASVAVAKMLAAAERPAAAVGRLWRDGALDDAMGEAIEVVLAAR